MKRIPGLTPSNPSMARIVAPGFFFGMTCGREEMKRFTIAVSDGGRGKLPVVFSAKEARHPDGSQRGAWAQSIRAALSHARMVQGCGPPRSVIISKIGDIEQRSDADSTLNWAKGQKDRKVMCRRDCLDLLRALVGREARRKVGCFP